MNHEKSEDKESKPPTASPGSFEEINSPNTKEDLSAIDHGTPDEEHSIDLEKVVEEE